MGFKRLDPEDFVVSVDSVTSTLWSTDAPTLTTFFTSSTQEQSSPGDFYLDVYQTSSLDNNAAVQFSIAYCDALVLPRSFQFACKHLHTKPRHKVELCPL